MKQIFLPLILIFATQVSFADEILRTADKPQVAPMKVVKTVYREETYMGDYYEEVPYAVEEAYREKVPYREYESYQDTEDYYTSERVCRPMMEYEERCDGFGANRRCSRVPVRGERCDMMMVRKSRPVTKHRWVTKEREETRYRKVTKYRTETKCCRQQTRQVPDRQFTVDVEVRFPANAALIGNETEKFYVTVKGDESTATVDVTPSTAIYTYLPQVTKVNAFSFVVNMMLAPTYTPADLAENTISQMQITALGKAVSINFIDMGNVRKVQTTYVLTLLDANGTELLRAQKSIEDKSEIQWALPITLKDGAEVKARLQVRRNGIVISAPVDFTVEKPFKVLVEEIYDVKPYVDESQVGKFSFSGEGSSTVIYFRDQTKNIASVKTSYTLEISFTGSRDFKTKTFARDQLKVMSDGRIAVSLGKDMGFTREVLSDITWATGIYVKNTVTRQSNKIPKGQVSFEKNVTLWMSGY